MAVAQRGAGARATLGAVASQIHPVFMLPPLAASWFGATLAADASLLIAAIHSLAIFAAVYTAHVKDGYVDYYLREEDDHHPLTRHGCRVCLVLSTALFLGCLALLGVLVGWGAVAITAPTWLIGYLHAPQLDMHPIGVTMGYPVGIALSLLGGYYVQAISIAPLPLAFATVFLILLSGIKIIDDTQDYSYDRSIEKPTTAVLLGRTRAKTLASGIMGFALILVLGFTAVGLFPVGSLLAAITLGGVAFLALRADPATSTALLIRGSYVFFALLIAAVWFEPLAPV